MKNPINKSNLRRPLKGILLLIILLIASNLFISSISQFFIVNREIDNIGKYYRSIGTIRPLDENNYDVKEAQEIITGDPMIAFEDNRRFTIGLIDGLYRNKRNDSAYSEMIGSNVNDTIFIGELKEVDKYTLAENIYEGTILRAKVTDILAGIPNYIESEFYYKEYQEHRFLFLPYSIMTGEKYEYINNDVIDQLFQLEQGKKYLFRTEVYVQSNAGSAAKPLYDGGPLYIELDDNGYIDWDNPQFKIIKEEMDFINENIISYDLIGTKDMTAMQEVQENAKDYYLVDGRWIDKEDYDNQNHVVIIHETIAKNHNISIGDKLDIKMRDSEYGVLLSTEKDKIEWRNYYTSEPKSFEVVGIFKNNRAAQYECMYIPESTMPMELGRYTGGLDEPIPVRVHSYSFVLKNAEDETTFIEKYREPLKELGYELSFLMNSIDSFKEASDPIKRSTAISAMVFSMLLILIQGFVIYVYIDGHKLNYAIERALGIPAKISGKHLVLPLVIFGIIASVLGGYTGYQKAIEESTEILSSIPSNVQRTVDFGLDIKYFILFIILSMLPFVIMLFLRIKQLKNSSVIDLINNNKKKKILQEESKEESEYIDMVKATTVSQSTEAAVYVKEEEEGKEQYIEDHRKDSKKALRRFSINYTLRSKVTSIFLIILAGIFTFALLWMNYLTIKNNELIEKAYKDSIITGDIVAKGSRTTSHGTGPIHRRHIDRLMETGLVEDYKSIAWMNYEELYIDRDGAIKKYEIGEKDKVHVFIKHPIFVVYASNKSYNSSDGIINLTDLNIIDNYSLEDFDKEYTRGYSKNGELTILDENGEEGFPILVAEKAMDHYDLKLGDKILLEPASRHRQLSVRTYGTIVGTYKGISTGKNYYGKNIVNEDMEVFIYPMEVLNNVEMQIFYSKIEFEFKQEKNKELISRKAEIKGLVSNNSFNEFATELKLWDEELTNVIEPLEKNLSLLEVLYPITFTLSIVIAGILVFIMVLRRTTDVAILRILGVKEKEVRWNIFKENLILVLIGTAIACIAVFAISIKSYPIDLVKYIMVTGGYMLGTTAGLILGIGKVTNKKPLEMLQVKE
ncbi:ABC transporter permease [Tissierella carlieri]|uniref:FtsX-like permease family protein n=1 Tax=Tissierella carlieri TaxID=689904 RepID=UPI001C1266B7|nr:FtsX-like permease family protein [Tissierella carlieri]MBU5312804.1 ABC transporter permease [Tissierella carlieri]